jgi:hypothetical protein
MSHTLRSTISLLVSLALAGCDGTHGEDAVSPAQFLAAEDPTGFEVLSSVGVAPHTIIVRAVNRFGASVHAPITEEITVDGLATAVQFDGYGYGALTRTEPGKDLVEGGFGPVEVFTVASDWPLPPLQRAWPSPIPAQPAAPGGELPHPAMGALIQTGGVVADGSSVWWGGAGAAPHRVLEADGDILGMQTGNIDLDGVEDAVVWTTDKVFLLKGRAGGGLAWGGALEAPGYEVAGADMGDLSSDQLPDIAIAWMDPSGDGLLDVLEGDGLFRFVTAEPRDIPGRPTSLVVGDQTGEGLAQVTVLLSDGNWSRFIRGAELQYMPIGPVAPTGTMILPEGSSLLRAGDVNGDGAAEIAIGGPRAPGQPRGFWFVDVATDALRCLEEPKNPDLQCGTEFLPLENEAGAWATLGDGNGDYFDDIFLEHDTRVLYAVALDPEEINGKYAKIRVMELPAYGPIDVMDADRDGELDLFLAGGLAWWQWRGQGYSSLDRFWAPWETPDVFVREALVPPFAFVELDNNDDTIEILGFTLEEGDTELLVLQYLPGSDRADRMGDVVVDPDARVPDDLAVCGTDAYVVVGGEVQRLNLLDPSDPAIAVRAGSAVTRVDCGEGPGGSEVATVEDGRVQPRFRATLAAFGAPIEGSAQDVALGDVGNGPEVSTCETPDCSVVWWDYGAGAVFARGDSQGIVAVDSAGTAQPLGGAGWLSVADLDRDGNLDLLGLSGVSSLVTLHRSTGDGIAPAELFHSELGWSRVLGVRDGDGDGHSDLWGIDLEGDLSFVRSTPVPTETSSP